MHIESVAEPKKSGAENAEVTLPSGLIGLPKLTKFLLIYDPEIYPFIILRHREENEMDFLAVDPNAVLKDGYHLEVSDGDAKELGLTPAGPPPLILNVAIIKSTEPPIITANLLAPLLFNRATGIGKQVMLENYSRYSAEHRLDIRIS